MAAHGIKQLVHCRHYNYPIGKIEKLACNPSKLDSMHPLPTFILYESSCYELIYTIRPFILHTYRTGVMFPYATCGLLPESQKATIVTPIFKKHATLTQTIKNYRPISNFTSISKSKVAVRIRRSTTDYMDTSRWTDSSSNTSWSTVLCHSTETAFSEDVFPHPAWCMLPTRISWPYPNCSTWVGLSTGRVDGRWVTVLSDVISDNTKLIHVIWVQTSTGAIHNWDNQWTTVIGIQLRVFYIRSEKYPYLWKTEEGRCHPENVGKGEKQTTITHSKENFFFIVLRAWCLLTLKQIQDTSTQRLTTIRLLHSSNLPFPSSILSSVNFDLVLVGQLV